MISFFACLILLLVGFFTYSKVIEKVFRVDDRPTPAIAHPDGVDYIPMKTWRIFLIQLLNIAGLGPIYGTLSGACWGPRSTCGSYSAPSWAAAYTTSSPA